MREYTAEEAVSLRDDDHLVQPLIAHAEKRPDHPLLAYPEGGRFVDVTARDAYRTVRDVGKGLLGLGLEAGQRVAIMSHTRIEWTYLDYGILSAGGVTVPIYETSSTEQMEWILTDSDARALFVENHELKERYEQIADATPNVKEVFVLDDGGLDEIVARGEDVADQTLDERTNALTLDDLATIIYTSGTTGRPKGCLLTHGNLRWDAMQTLAVLDELITPEDRQLLFLPLAHSFAKILAIASLESGTQIGYSQGIDHIRDEMQAFRPTYLAAVPRIFEKVYAGAAQQAEADGKGAIFDRAADVAVEYSRGQDRGGASLLVKAQHALFDRLVYGKLRDVFGGQLKAATSGGGPLGERLAHFFRGIGIDLYEGYGLTETSPVLTANRPDAWKIGTVGQPIPGTTIRIAEDGEVLASGEQIFQGYHENEKATSEAIDPDGWFHTGDIGELDDDGFLRITGRKKEIIVTAAGKNVAPAVLEERLKKHRLVSQAMVVGDNRRFIACLVTIDEEALPAWLEKHGKSAASVAELRDDPDLRAEVQAAVEHANEAVSRAESIREFRILPEDFTVEGGELTPTLKVKRRVVSDEYGEIIEEIYA